MTEREYRSLDLDSYSSIKAFLDDRKKYFRQYIKKEKINEKSQESDDMRFGGLVDCILLSLDEFDDRYIVSTSNKPSGQMLDFVHDMFKQTMAATNEEGVLCRTLEDMIGQAYKTVGFKRDSLEVVTERFLIKKEGWDYYEELRERDNKLVVTAEEVEMAHKVANALEVHPYTRDVIGWKPSDKYKVYNQFIIMSEYRGLPIKCMVDKLILNEEKMQGHPFDLKVMGNIDIFPYNYRNLKYYIQNAVYTTLLREHFPEYKIAPMKFITADKYMYMDPLIVKTSEEQLQDAINGFEYKGMKYTGLDKAVDDLLFHKEREMWTSSREAIETGGIIALNF